MWNPREHIDDLIAMGMSRAEAVAETREYAAMRIKIAAKERKRYAARAEEADRGARPLALHLVNPYQRRKENQS